MEVSKTRAKSNRRVLSSKPYYNYGLSSNMYSSNPRERDTRLNVQRRQKLAMTIVDQLTQKLNVYKNRDIVQREVENLMKKEIINDRDLKELEKTIKRKIKEKTEKENLKQNLIKANSNRGFIEEKNMKGDNLRNKEEEKENEEELNASDMSGASDLDKFNEKTAKERDREEKMSKYKDCKCMKLKPSRPKVEIDFDKFRNEWEAIDMYKIKKGEERERDERNKNWETKMRTRAELIK